MKKSTIITTLLITSCAILNGCMTTGPIVDDLDHYQKGDTYESIREKNEEELETNNGNRATSDLENIEKLEDIEKSDIKDENLNNNMDENVIDDFENNDEIHTEFIDEDNTKNNNE